jgi:outer membrane protein assembly factor BamB
MFRSTLLILPLLFATLTAPADDWPQWLGPQRDSVWRERGILEKFPAGGPPVRWRTPIGAGYSGPAVAGGKVFLLDRRVRVETADPRDPFARGRIPGTERVLCLDAQTGAEVWRFEYDCPYTVSYAAGPRATPTVDGQFVFTLGTEGNLMCFDTRSGFPVWSRDLKEFAGRTPLWGFAGHPLVHGDKLICLVGGEGTTAMAFDKRTGQELWRALSAKEPGYAPPTLIRAGGREQVILWHPEAANALDPATGALFWSVPFPSRAGMSIATPRQLGDRLFFSCFYNGSLMTRLAADRPAATKVYQSPKASEMDTAMLHTVMSTPFLEAGHIYGVCSYGQLRCLKADTGERVWETFAATTAGKPVRWANVFLVKQGDRFLLFNERGDLIFAKLSPQGYQELDRAHLLEPTNTDLGRPVVWSHPALANRCLYARNDREIICVSLAK